MIGGATRRPAEREEHKSAVCARIAVNSARHNAIRAPADTPLRVMRSHHAPRLGATTRVCASVRAPPLSLPSPPVLLPGRSGRRETMVPDGRRGIHRRGAREISQRGGLSARFSLACIAKGSRSLSGGEERRGFALRIIFVFKSRWRARNRVTGNGGRVKASRSCHYGPFRGLVNALGGLLVRSSRFFPLGGSSGWINCRNCCDCTLIESSTR
jgi:hypothetical protein